MKIYTIDQIKDIQNQQNYKYVGLFDQSGRAVITFNANNISPLSRLKEIETRLLSQALPDGYYFVKCKNVMAKNGTTDDYCLMKGEKLSEPPAPIIVESKAFQPEVLTYEGALKLQVDLERHKIENASLKQKIQDLEAELAEMSTLSENEEQQPVVSWIEQLTQIAAPLLDKHFQLKEQQLALKAYELKNRLPEKAPVRTKKAEDHKKLIEDTIMSFQDEPDVYEQLAALYNSALNQEDFLKNLKGDQELCDMFIKRSRNEQ
jgi:hypothetical protein